MQENMFINGFKPSSEILHRTSDGSEYSKIYYFPLFLILESYPLFLLQVTI
jgi:hypothetical protein